MGFLERMGEIQGRRELQGRSLDLATRNRLWSCVVQSIPDPSNEYLPRTWMYALYQRVWADFLKRPFDEMGIEAWRIRDQMKPLVLSHKWYVAYDLLEFLLNIQEHQDRQKLSELVIRVLDEEKAGFRSSGTRFVQITDPREIEAIDTARASATDRFAPVRVHLDEAVAKYSDRQNPDYRNSIKESISAVEAAVQILAGDSQAELGRALAMLESRAPIHGAFASALKSLYGYTSDASGIRHALSDAPNLDEADAKFMLVACAGFVSYLIQKLAVMAT